MPLLRMRIPRPARLFLAGTLQGGKNSFPLATTPVAKGYLPVRKLARLGVHTGWVLLDDERIFCVNYIVDDAPMAQIRGYWFNENDF